MRTLRREGRRENGEAPCQALDSHALDRFTLVEAYQPDAQAVRDMLVVMRTLVDRTPGPDQAYAQIAWRMMLLLLGRFAPVALRDGIALWQEESASATQGEA